MGNLEYQIVVGLGNPGAEYAGSRHNMGFMLLERFLAKHHPERWAKVHVCDSFCYIGSLGGARLVLAMPQTYMNASGTAVAKLLRLEKCDPTALLVVHDDLDLAPGRLRLRKGGASGGHHGIESIISELNGCANFARLRLGIGHGTDNTVDHVLSKFSAEELPAVEACLDCAVDALEMALRRGLSAAMNQYNGWVYAAGEDAAKKKVEEVESKNKTF